MCQRIECPQCHKPSFSGCGRHVEQVLGDVAEKDRCKCRDQAQTPGSRASASWIDKLLGVR